MAKAMNYLTEHQLLDYADLAAKTAQASARYNDLSTKIKATEERMDEIGKLKVQIITYSKTRDVYVAYRKAGCSKKFLVEHESEIRLHQATKRFFDGWGLKKLSTIKSLQAEYTTLLEEKKAAYADYRQVQDEMKELRIVKANVDRLLGSEEREEKENARQEER